MSSLIPLEYKKVEKPRNKAPGKDAVFANNITSSLEQPEKPSEEHQQTTAKHTDLSRLTYELRQDNKYKMKTIYSVLVMIK